MGAYYYLPIVKIMYFDEPAQASQRDARAAAAWCSASPALINMLFFAYPAPLLGAATAAAKSLF